VGRSRPAHSSGRCKHFVPRDVESGLRLELEEPWKERSVTPPVIFLMGKCRTPLQVVFMAQLILMLFI